MSLACAPAARVLAGSQRRVQRVQRAQTSRALLRQPRRALGTARRSLVTKAQGNEVQVEEVVEELKVKPPPETTHLFESCLQILRPGDALAVNDGSLSKSLF